MTIFVDHVEGRVNQSVRQRESRMMALFDRAHAELLSQQPNARFLFKMGGAHTMRGIGPNGIKTLGEHVAVKAKENTHKSLHISIYGWREESALPLPDQLRQNSYVLVDCERLRKTPFVENEEFAKALNGKDLIILLPQAENASKSQIRMKQKRFVRSKLTRFGLILIPLFLLLPVYGKALVSYFQRWRGKSFADTTFLRLPLICSLCMIALIVFQVTILLAAPDKATPTSSGIVRTLEAALVIAVFAALGVGVLRHNRLIPSERAYYWIATLGCLGCAMYIHAWGLGNLLGI